MRWLLTLLAVTLCGCVTVQPQPNTTVLVVPSMHGLHATSASYSFDRLYALVQQFRPDVVGVEIRPEDIGEPDAYLKRNYPPEMIALRDKYPQRVVGFDWLGPELQGKTIPEHYWQKKSAIKALERDFAKDPAMHSSEAERISAKELEILKSATPHSLADGRYHRLVVADRALMAKLAGKGRYSELVRFTAERDRRIDSNLVRIVRENRGKRIVFVMGADHFGYALERLRHDLGRDVRVVTPH